MLEYAEFLGEEREWSLHDLTLGDVNLIVGKNASGKSRTLNIIRDVAKAISGDHVLKDGNSQLFFDNEGEEVEYILDFANSVVVQERYRIGENTLLERDATGKGKIFAEKLGKKIEFQVPPTTPVTAARRGDSVQHSFLNPLHQWASSIYHYPFGGTLGKNHHSAFSKDDPGPDPKDHRQVVRIFDHGRKQFGEEYTDSIKGDFRSIGYPVDEIGLMDSPWDIAHSLSCLYVKESDLAGKTDQQSMSSGMFRALSVIVQTTYCIMADTPSCILIDDIGEGLDFERSCAIIDVLVSKAKDSSVQLIMSTNDRFVMNRVPIESWTVLQRQGSQVNVVNYCNSRDLFDKFKFTGLNNFDFFATDYLHAHE
ncbi:MAG: ATP-binding protein [Planctomycetales bacterium]